MGFETPLTKPTEPTTTTSAPLNKYHLQSQNASVSISDFCQSAIKPTEPDPLLPAAAIHHVLDPSRSASNNTFLRQVEQEVRRELEGVGEEHVVVPAGDCGE